MGKRRSVALLLLLLAGSVCGWLAWRGGHFSDRWIAGQKNIIPVTTPTSISASHTITADHLAGNENAIAERLTALDHRLDQIEAQAKTECVNTGHAEALLIAFAARRAVDRGAPLGYLEGEIRQRFGIALPAASALIIAQARNPVTLDELAVRLAAMGPSLTMAPQTGSTWTRLRNQLNDLFVLRRETRAMPSPLMRLDHAQMALREGKTADAIADVRLLSNSSAAQQWIDDAQRYAKVEQALDQIETTALTEPTDLRDGTGNLVGQPSTHTPALRVLPAQPSPTRSISAPSSASFSSSRS